MADIDLRIDERLWYIAPLPKRDHVHHHASPQERAWGIPERMNGGDRAWDRSRHSEARRNGRPGPFAASSFLTEPVS